MQICFRWEKKTLVSIFKREKVLPSILLSACLKETVCWSLLGRMSRVNPLTVGESVQILDTFASK